MTVVVNYTLIGAAPVFGSATYTGTVNENTAADTTVSGITISATDGDGDAITYSIISSSGPFKLKTDGTKVLTNGLTIDYETTNAYTLTIQAAANGKYRQGRAPSYKSFILLKIVSIFDSVI